MAEYGNNTVRVAQTFNEARLGSIVEIGSNFYIVGNNPLSSHGVILINLSTGGNYGFFESLADLNRTLLNEITDTGSDEPPLRIAVYNDVDILITKK